MQLTELGVIEKNKIYSGTVEHFSRNKNYPLIWFKQPSLWSYGSEKYDKALNAFPNAEIFFSYYVK